MNKNALIAVLGLAVAAVEIPAAEPSRNPSADGSVFRSFPTTSRSDLAGLVRSFAVRADPETWDTIRKLLKTTGDALAQKANLVADVIADCSSMDLSGDEKAKAADTLASFFSWMSAFAGSPDSSLERMKEWTASEIEGIEDTAFSAQALDALFLFACARPAIDPFPWMRQNSQTSPVLKAFEKAYAAVIETACPRTEKESRESADVRAIVEFWADFIGEVQKSVTRMDFQSPEAERAKNRLLLLAPSLDAAVKQLAEAQTSGEMRDRLRTMFDVFLGNADLTADCTVVADSFLVATIVGPDCERVASRGRRIARSVAAEELDLMLCTKRGILENEDALTARIDVDLWSFLSGPFNISADVPLLFTRNLKITDEDLRRVLRAGEPVDDESWSSKLDPDEKPFGNGLVVVVTLQGVVRPILARDLTASRFFGDATFKDPEKLRVLPSH